MPAVLSEGSGSVEVRYKLPLDQSVLGQLPVQGCQVGLAHSAEALLNPWRGSCAGAGSGSVQSRLAGVDEELDAATRASPAGFRACYQGSRCELALTIAPR